MNGIPLPLLPLAESTLCGSVVIVLLFLIRPLVRRWLGARAMHALWLVALVRLLIPWSPHTPMSVLPAPAPNENAKSSVTIRSFVIGGDLQPASVSPKTLPKRKSPAFAESLSAYFVLVWFTGVAGVLGLSLAGALRAAPLLRRAKKIAKDSAAMQALASLPFAIRHLRVLETAELKSPALCGLFRPTILLPPGWADNLAQEELRCVLLHEIGHHRRWDVLWRWGFLVARAIHWFNPLVWLAEREMRIDQEMACDEWVLAHANGIDAQT